jgi:hypothetical protein
MCAKTHAKYRNVRKGLPEKSGFSPKMGGILPELWPKMLANDRKFAESRLWK